MLVGAQCRNLLDWRFGYGLPLRSTNDTDVALALQDWQQFDILRQHFRPAGESGHRFHVGGIVTDIIAFGGVETPPGTTSRSPRNFEMNVHGFTDTYQRTDDLPIAEGVSIRIPRPEGYAVLKTHAWLDRSAFYDYKDGPDLALAVHWYAQDQDRLFEPLNQWALDQHDFDQLRAAAALLGKDMLNGLSQAERGALTTRTTGADRDLLANNFGVGRPGWPGDRPTRRVVVDALLDQLGDGNVQ